MAEYVYIDNYSKKGKLGIAPEVFNSLVSTALDSVPGIKKSTASPRRKLEFRLNGPICTKIRRGIVHVSVCVDANKNSDLQELSRRIQNEINNILLLATEQVPFDVQVKVMNLI